MATLRRIDPFSCAKIYALFNLFIGLIFGIFYGVFFLILGAVAGEAGIALVGFGIAAIIGIPLVSAVFGLIIGLIGAAIYNFIASRFGGLEIELK